LKARPPPLGVVEVDPDEREVGPVVPADEAGPHPLEVGEGHVDLDGLRAGDMGVGEDEPVL
jgi:hypothetical protein